MLIQPDNPKKNLLIRGLSLPAQTLLRPLNLNYFSCLVHLFFFYHQLFLSWFLQKLVVLKLGSILPLSIFGARQKPAWPDWPSPSNTFPIPLQTKPTREDWDLLRHSSPPFHTNFFFLFGSLFWSNDRDTSNNSLTSYTGFCFRSIKTIWRGGNAIP